MQETPNQFPDNVKLEKEEGTNVSGPSYGAIAPVQASFPEGGRQAWLTIFGGFLIQYASFGYINAFGVYQDYYVRIYLNHFTPSDIGWIGGMQIFLNFSLGMFTGRAFDRGYFYHLMIAGGTLQIISLFMLSLSHQNSYYQVFLTHGLCLGLGSGLSYVPSLSITSHYFQQRRPLAIGIVSSGSALGAILHPIMLNKLFNGHIGFHNGVRISAGLNTFLIIVGILCMRTRLPPKPKNTPWPFFKYLREPVYVFAVLGSFFAFCGLFFCVFYLQLDAVLHGIDTNIAFYSLSVLNAASIFGRIIPAYFARRYGGMNILIICLIATGIITICFAALKNAAGVLVFAVFFGFFSGGAIALTPVAVGILAKDPSEIGSGLGLVFGIAGFMGLFATPIAGALLADQYHWIRASLFAGITLIVSGFWNIAIRIIVGKQKGTNWI